MTKAEEPFHRPFEALAEKFGVPVPPDEPTRPKAPARAVVRIERKDRGGKTVTVIEKLELPYNQREGWMTELKSGLGCGGRVEGDALVLQGDQRDRAAAWLTARGVRRVTVAN